ncbi:19067_t:CDS:2, partial [Dentiscutata erythropus]
SSQTTDHKLTNEISLEELSQYAPKILDLLTDNKEKRCQARNRLIKGYGFSKEQIFVLIPLQRIGRCKRQAPVPEGPELKAEKVNICQVLDSTGSEETIKEIAQCIIRDKLSEREVKAISRILEETSPDTFVALSRLSRFQRELRTLNASEKIIFAIFNPEERLNLYNVSNILNKQALADVMIMLCIRLAEIKNLCISNRAVTGYTKNRGQQDIFRVFRSLEKNEAWTRQLLTWIQEAIVSRELRDPGKLGSTYLSTFLKKDEFLPESGKPLLPSSLRKLGAVFASVAHGPKNASKANTYASEALLHSPDNHASPSKRQDHSASLMKTNIQIFSEGGLDNVY